MVDESVTPQLMSELSVSESCFFSVRFHSLSVILNPIMYQYNVPYHDTSFAVLKLVYQGTMEYNRAYSIAKDFRGGEL